VEVKMDGTETEAKERIKWKKWKINCCDLAKKGGLEGVNMVMLIC
jgi:hypothetical protein